MKMATLVFPVGWVVLVTLGLSERMERMVKEGKMEEMVMVLMAKMGKMEAMADIMNLIGVDSLS